MLDDYKKNNDFLLKKYNESKSESERKIIQDKITDNTESYLKYKEDEIGFNKII